MRESARIFFACALGALLGGLLGLEFKDVSIWLCLPSALLGGVIGWVMYDVRALGAAIARAWREVINWRPNKRYWKTLAKNTANEILQRVTGFAYYGLFAGLWAISYCCADMLWYAYPALRTALYELYWTLLPIPFAGIGLMFSTISLIDSSHNGVFNPVLKRPRFIRRFCLYCNPIALPFAIIGGIVMFFNMIWQDPACREDIKLCIRNLGRFAKRAFILAHSDLRLLCLVDATIGALAGYFLSSALLGALVGGVSGLLNYWVVSIKILHLVPARARNE